MAYREEVVEMDIGSTVLEKMTCVPSRVSRRALRMNRKTALRNPPVRRRFSCGSFLSEI